MKILCVILILLCAFLGLSWWNSSIQHKYELKTYILNDSLLQTKIKHITDSSGKQIDVYKVQAITSEQLAQSSSKEAEQMRYQLKLAGGKPSQVTSHTTVQTTTHDSVAVAVHDTLSCLDSGVYQVAISDGTDSFMHIQGMVTFRAIPQAIVFQSAGIDYTLRGGTSITYFNKSRFLHKPQLELLVSNDNPKTTTNKVQTYYITNNKKWYQKFYTHVLIGVAATVIVQHYIK